MRSARASPFFFFFLLGFQMPCSNLFFSSKDPSVSERRPSFCRFAPFTNVAMPFLPLVPMLQCLAHGCLHIWTAVLSLD